MPEYIERQAAIDAVMAVYVRTAGYKTRERVLETREAIQKLPAADVAPVVRCEDCLFWKSGENECESWEWCKMLNTDMPADGFCRYGEPKEKDDAKAD